MLGGFNFASDTWTVPVLSRKARAIVTYLTLQSGRFHSREKLAALLWSGCSDAQARMSLRQALSAIRKAMPCGKEGRILTDGDGVRITLDDLDIDVERFEELAASPSPEKLERAMETYRGDLLEGFGVKEEPFDDWLREERERLRAMSISVLERLVEFYATANNFAPFARAATRLLGSEPLREDIHRDLMRAYAAQGRLNLALKQYEHCRNVLQRQFQVQPEHETRDLYRELRARRAATTPTKARSSSEVEGTSLGAANSSYLPFDTSGPYTCYVKSHGVNIAYQVTGDGPIDLVYVQGWVSNLDYAWESPRLTHVLRRLGSFTRLIRIDKRGTGLSDRNVGLATLEERMEDVRAVLDAIGSHRTVLFGSSEGGIMCMLFAATYPDRTSALILHGAYARGLWAEDYPWGRTIEELEDDLTLIERDWGKAADLNRAAPSLMDDAHERAWFAAYLRNSASPADALSLWRWSIEIDVRDILKAIHVPTLIIQRTGDRWAKTEEAHFLARHIPAATYVELPGDDHLIWGADSDRLVDAIQDYLAGATLVTATKCVLSTVMQMELFDVLAADIPCYRTEVDRALRRADGRAICQTEHGFIAVFEGPTRAIHCANELRERMMDLGLVSRAAVHIGECEQCGEDLQGTPIQYTSQLLAYAKPGTLVVSGTVRELLLGSKLAFDDCGEINVGDSGTQRLFSVTSRKP